MKRLERVIPNNNYTDINMCIFHITKCLMCTYSPVKVSPVLLVHRIKPTALREILITLQYLIFPPSDGHKRCYRWCAWLNMHASCKKILSMTPRFCSIATKQHCVLHSEWWRGLIAPEYLQAILGPTKWVARCIFFTPAELYIKAVPESFSIYKRRNRQKLQLMDMCNF